MKECLKCHRLLDENLFGNDVSRSDGKQHYCKDCRRKDYRERKGIGLTALLSYSDEELADTLRKRGWNVTPPQTEEG